jgi:CHAT domain-containing protein
VPRPGDDDLQLLQNLRHRFDAHVSKMMFRSVQDRHQALAFDDEMRAAIGENTILLDVYLARTADGVGSLVARVLTREGTTLFSVQNGFSAQPMGVSVAGREFRMQEIGAAVGTLRAGLQRASSADADSRTSQALADLSRAVLGERLAKRLQELHAAGKDHLCVIPHGPLHFLPFHLLHDDRGDLATRFVVTVIPNVALALRRAKRAKSERKGAAVFGLSFGVENPLGLPPIPGAVAEAATVARTLGVPLTPERAATRAALFDALERCRWVHLATHGAQAVEASMLHEIFLAPDGDDGRVRACDVLPARLQGLELVTLSTCESALGRFDEGDNLRGLPAALLLAGAQNLVGTLWEVDDDAGATFFGAFYRALAGGNEVRAAFAVAQRTVRAEYPQAALWAPFYLMEG